MDVSVDAAWGDVAAFGIKDLDAIAGRKVVCDGDYGSILCYSVIEPLPFGDCFLIP
jgi:hypothetical protein